MSDKKMSNTHKSKEQYAYKAYARIIFSCLVTIAVAFAVTAVLNRPRFSTTFDFTQQKVNTLTDASLKILAGLSKTVQIVCVPQPSVEDKYCDKNRDIINLYQRKSQFIVYAGILNLADKVEIQKIQPSGFGRLVLITDDNKSELDGDIDEQRLTNALINLTKYKKTVYFLTGHGEPSLQSIEENRNYSDVVATLQSRAYNVKEWNASQGALPNDAQMLVAGDNMLPYDQTVDLNIQHFLARGGQLILISNPYRATGLTGVYTMLNVQPEPVLLTLDIHSGIGKQLQTQSGSRPPVVVTHFNVDSPATQVIAQLYGPNAFMLVDGGQPFRLSSQPVSSDFSRAVLMEARFAAPITLSDKVRNSLDLQRPFTLSPDKNFDPNQSWPIAMDIQWNQGPHHPEVVLFGFSLVGAPTQEASITQNLIPLAVAALYKDKDLISIPPKKIQPKQFHLERNPGAWLPLFALLLPFSTALGGLWIWWRRRKA